MATAGDHLAPLSAPEREKLESWLVDFDLAWSEDLLARRAGQLPPGDRLRVPALIEMVKIDLERRWQRGRQVLLEPYLRAYPELASAEGALAVLLRAEYEVRAQFGTPPAPSELLRRFPSQATAIRQLAPPSTPSRPDVRRSTPAAKETKHSASSTPSVAAGSAAARALPEQFGARYRIVKKLGRGGMGTVYLAKDTQLDRPVALKVPHFEPDDGPEVLQRFYQEARIAATLDHPNICPIYDVGEVGGVPYLTMKCIVGKPLTDFIRADRPLPVSQAAALVRKAALALQAAHARGIVHRDLKPSNIMIHHGGEPVVMDFGLAVRPHREGSARLTRTGTPLGTPAYMAPEQVRGDTHGQGPACDVYSLGVVLYELLTGRPPFEGPVYAVLALVLTQEPPPPGQLRPGLDPQIEAVCKKAMSKKPEDRYATMGEFAEALAACLRKRSPAPPKPQRRLPVALLGVAGGALLAVLLLVVVVVLALPRGAGPGKTETGSQVVVVPPTQPQPTPRTLPAQTNKAPAQETKPPAPPPQVNPKPAAAESTLEKYLPDDAVAVLTVNVRQVLDSAAVKKHLGTRLDKLLKSELIFRAGWNATNYDPLKDISSLRVAVTSMAPPNVKVLVIVQGRIDPARFEAVWAASGALHTDPDGAGGSFRTYEIADAFAGQPGFYAVLGESAFAVSTTREPLLEVLAKEAGRRRTALKDQALRPLLGRVDERASICLAASGALTLDGQPLREALGCEWVVAALHVADDLRAEVMCGAANRDAADKLNREVATQLVKASVQLTLEAEKDPQLLPLLDIVKGIKGTLDDKTVTIRGAIPAAVLDTALTGKEADAFFKGVDEGMNRQLAPIKELQQAVQFNNALVEAVGKATAESEKLAPAFKSLASPDDLAEAKKVSAAFLKAVAEIKLQVKGLQAPPGKSAQAFRDAVQHFLDGQERIVRDDLGEILRIAEDPQLLPTTKDARVKAVQARMATRNDKADIQAFKDAQKVFAKEHKITLR